ncbi:sodium:alanine symporter family protein [uncultured Mailhella sp.]|uniref:alanine/glycine:cation symporter family protein n=1 Tax=uncultured Mailhella sp. TaxID=1981031 RepID=UPI0025FE5B17|nr:sodium:alanine symporter family protein [uncultured Mailhella sp.]
MEFISQIVDAVNGVLWGWLLLFLLCGTGIFYTIRLRFIQLRKLPHAFRRLFSNISLHGESADHTGMSSFQALATAVAAQVGTGNIAGAATAIAAGGPGAIFWMWLSAFFGMATNYSEAVLAQKYKTTNERGETVGGPAYYIRAAFPGAFGKALAGFFSVAIILALGFMGNMVQSNSIGAAFSTAFGLSPVLVGVVVALISAAIFLGGAKRIAWVMEKLVPLMALLYVGGCLIIIFANITALPGAFKTIFVMAFDPQSAGGGALGITVREAMRYGVARGLFSNEAGMGSTPHAHALAKVAHPDDQGMMAMMGVFIDTFVVLTCTALVIVITGEWNCGSTGTELAQIAFDTVFGSLGNIYIAVCLFFFAFSTIIGWYFFGEANVKALFGAKYVKIYAAIVVVFIVIGSGLKVNLVWNMSDMFNGLMVLPNLIGLLALSGVVVAIAKSKRDD